MHPRDTVVDYDPAWPGVFEALRGRLEQVLLGVDHRVEHVGSTAVPGLAGKPVIDVDVVVASAAVVSVAVSALAAGGWRHEGDLGVAGREAFAPPVGLAYHHLYVVVAGSRPHRDHVDLRDHLRSHPDDAVRYGALKRHLSARLAVDRGAYTAGKAASITSLLAAARR